MKRLTLLAAVVALGACGELPTQPPLDVSVAFSTVPVGPGLTAETFDLADGSACDLLPKGKNVTPEGLIFYTFGGTIREGTSHSGPCAYEGMSIDLENNPDVVATWTSLWVLPPSDWPEPEYPVDIFVFGPFTTETVVIPTEGWSEVVLPAGPTVTGWSISGPMGAVFDDITYGVPVDEPDEEPGSPSDPVTKDDCKKGGWEAFGFKNQGQCVRFVETKKDSR